MAVDYIKVNTQKLEEDSSEVKKYLEDLVEKKDELSREITGLNKMWSGEAYDAFKEAVDTDLKALQQIIDNVTQVYNYEQTAKTDYENCEKQIAALIDSVSV